MRCSCSTLWAHLCSWGLIWRPSPKTLSSLFPSISKPLSISKLFALATSCLVTSERSQNVSGVKVGRGRTTVTANIYLSVTEWSWMEETATIDCMRLLLLTVLLYRQNRWEDHHFPQGLGHTELYNQNGILKSVIYCVESRCWCCELWLRVMSVEYRQWDRSIFCKGAGHIWCLLNFSWHNFGFVVSIDFLQQKLLSLASGPSATQHGRHTRIQKGWVIG